jgi:hypothetical protein
MFPKLSKDKKLLREIAQWKEQVELISDDKAKTKIYNNIKLIQKKVDEIDIAHDTNYLGQIRPHFMDETRKSISKARAENNKIIKLHLGV